MKSRTVLVLMLAILACVPVARKQALVLADLKSLQTRFLQSVYFDRVMGYEDSSFEAVSFARALEIYAPMTEGVLLECFDDYQGYISAEDIRKYDLYLATRLDISIRYKRPNWLHPMLVLVPNGKNAPNQERFMTANIRRIRFIREEEYYAPLNVSDVNDVQSVLGRKIFKDNCLFCHSLNGIGGNKGIRLLETYQFADPQARKVFIKNFFGFHKADSSQNISQFVDRDKIRAVANFLNVIQISDSN